MGSFAALLSDGPMNIGDMSSWITGMCILGGYISAFLDWVCGEEPGEGVTLAVPGRQCRLAFR